MQKKDAATTFLKREAKIVKLEFPSQTESNSKTSMLEFLSLANMLAVSKAQSFPSTVAYPPRMAYLPRMARSVHDTLNFLTS